MMKKSLIALAVSSAFVLPAMSQADTTVYGLAQVEIANVDPECTNPPGSTVCDSFISEVDNANGRVGVKSSEDLGNGWSGLAKFEFKADTADGVAGGTNVSLTPRETMVGLKGKGIGQFELGRLKSPYKYSGGVKYDPFVATTLEARGNGGMTGGEYGQSGFLSNTIGYRGQFGPVKVQFVYGPQSNDGRYSLSAEYGQDNFEVGLATIDEGDRGAGLSGTNGTLPTTSYNSYSSTKVYGKFKFGGMHTVVAQYEMTDDGLANPGATKTYKPTVLFLGYHLTMGKNMFVAEYGSMDSDGQTDGANNSYDTTMFVLGVVHKMSKTTRIFGGYGSSSNDAKTGLTGNTLSFNNTGNVISVGLRKDFK